MSYKIKTIIRTVADLKADGGLDATIDFNRHAHRGRTIAGAFATNPNLTSGSQPAEMIGVIDGRAFGSMRTMPMKMVADGKIYETSANPDIMVDEALRKTGYALELLEFGTNCSRDQIRLDFYVSMAARKVMKLMGAKVFDIVRFVLVKRSSLLVGKRLPKKVAPVACVLLDAFFACHRAVVGALLAVKTLGWKFSLADDDASLAEFSELVSQDDHRFRHVEDLAFLKWILKHDFGGVENANKHLWRISKSGETLGFVMMRGYSGEHGRIIDWQAVPGHERHLHWMLLLTAWRLLSKCRVVFMPVSGADRDLVKALSRLCPKVSVQAAVVDPGNGPLKSHDGWDCQENWRLRPTMGDSCLY